jgi:hypothetical protein
MVVWSRQPGTLCDQGNPGPASATHGVDPELEPLEPELEPDVDPEPEPDPEPPDVDPDVDPDPEEPEPDPDPDVDPDPEPELDPDDEPDVDPELDPDEEPELDPDPVPLSLLPQPANPPQAPPASTKALIQAKRARAAPPLFVLNAIICLPPLPARDSVGDSALRCASSSSSNRHGEPYETQ